MKQHSPLFTRRRVLGAAGTTTLVVTALGLQGFRGPWRHGYDPQRFDARMDWLEEHIADDLHLTPQQEPQFHALMTRIHDVVRQRREARHRTDLALQQALQQDSPNLDAVAAALKQRNHDRADPAALDQLVDDALAFYRTLDAKQQKTVRTQMLHRLQWRLSD